MSPEFQILHATSGIHYLNLIESSIKTRPFHNRTAINTTKARLANNNDDLPFLDFSDEIALYESQGIMAVLDRLDILLCRGQLTSDIKAIISDAITAIADNYNTNSNMNDDYSSEDAVEDAIYFVMASPNYMISK